ncbi:MAG: hypothetical protein Q8M76_03095 [Spirochaetaceae bacterium]|nr:hypothetical protein [Spirochaetaceae bacterium]
MRNATFGKALALGVIASIFSFGRGAALTITTAGNVAGTYSPNNTVTKTHTMRVKCGGTIGDFCVVLTQTSLTPATVPPAEGLTYEIWTPSASPLYQLSLDGTPDASTEVLSGNFPVGSTANTTVTLRMATKILPSTIPAPGTYVATIRADLYASAYPPSGAVQSTRTFTVTVTVGSFFDVSVVASGGAFLRTSTTGSMAFGTIIENDFRALDIVVRTNVGYGLSLRSTRGSAMRNASDGSLLPYILSFNGGDITLPAGSTVSVVTGAIATYGATKSYPVIVTIPPFLDLPTDGNYSDTVTIVLSSP